jgi:hypothetical protein
LLATSSTTWLSVIAIDQKIHQEALRFSINYNRRTKAPGFQVHSFLPKSKECGGLRE